LKIALYIAVLIMTIAAPGALRAQPVMQPYYPGFAGLPPYEILASVRTAGLDPVSRPARQGPVYVLRALNPAGQEVRVVVDARMGRIVKVVAVAPTDPGAFAPPASIPPGRAVPDSNGPTSRSAALPSGIDDDTDFEPLHPGAPGILPKKPPARTAAKPPPLPRSRPKEAAVTAPSASAAPITAAAPAATPATATPAPTSTGPSASAENTAPSAIAIDE
jgi:eukaryotic-like serine/threonine-protein kinase